MKNIVAHHHHHHYLTNNRWAYECICTTDDITDEACRILVSLVLFSVISFKIVNSKS